jgi:hypothetical protein
MSSMVGIFQVKLRTSTLTLILLLVHQSVDFGYTKVLSGQLNEENMSLSNYFVVSSYLCFNDQFHRQMDKVSTESLLPPVPPISSWKILMRQPSVFQPISPTAAFHVVHMFVIWILGSQRLKEFLNCNNSIHHSSQFSMENVTASYRPLLGTDISRQLDIFWLMEHTQSSSTIASI